jgi:hypothetical protein
MTDWREAAARYRKAQSSEKRIALNNEIEKTAHDLAWFLNSEKGDEALKLLAASGLHIIFGTEKAGNGKIAVYLLNGTGLWKSVEATGSSAAYEKQRPSPQLSGIDAMAAITVAVNPETGGGRSPDRIMAWLRNELDAIAERAPA